jgi:hypothetical protein
MPTRSNLIRFAATLGVGVVFLDGSDDLYARGGGGGGGSGSGTNAFSVANTGARAPAPIGNTQGTPGACKGPACAVGAPIGASRHCEKFGGGSGGRGGGTGGACF